MDSSESCGLVILSRLKKVYKRKILALFVNQLLWACFYLCIEIAIISIIIGIGWALGAIFFPPSVSFVLFLIIIGTLTAVLYATLVAGLHKPPLFVIAQEIDDIMGLDNRMAASVDLLPQQERNGFVQALLEDTERRTRETSGKDLYPIKVGKKVWGGVLLILVLACAIFIPSLPGFNDYGFPEIFKKVSKSSILKDKKNSGVEEKSEKKGESSNSKEKREKGISKSQKQNESLPGAQKKNGEGEGEQKKSSQGGDKAGQGTQKSDNGTQKKNGEGEGGQKKSSQGGDKAGQGTQKKEKSGEQKGDNKDPGLKNGKTEKTESGKQGKQDQEKQKKDESKQGKQDQEKQKKDEPKQGKQDQEKQKKDEPKQGKQDQEKQKKDESKQGKQKKTESGGQKSQKKSGERPEKNKDQNPPPKTNLIPKGVSPLFGKSEKDVIRPGEAYIYEPAKGEKTKAGLERYYHYRRLAEERLITQQIAPEDINAILRYFERIRPGKDD